MSRHAFDESLAWIQQLLATTRDFAVILTDPSGQVVDWLGAAEHVFGHTAEQAVGQPIDLIFTPEDLEAGLHRQEMTLAATAGRSEDDRWHLRGGGVRFWGSGILSPIRDAGGQLLGFCKVVRDRTDVRTQLDAHQHRIAADADDKARRTQFMLRLGHELRNPLGAIRNATYLVQRMGNDAVARPCEVLTRQVDLLVRLLDDLAEATRADAHISRIQPQAVVLQDAVRLAASGVQAAMAAKRQQLAVVLPDVPVAFEADPARLQQMLLNLLGNACKYTPEGGHVSVGGTVEGRMVVIHVEDDGVGIADDVLPHIFELFTRGTPADGATDGLGVGLAVVRELATLHGGGVEARSGAEGGSVFTLRLPLSQE
ncbi:MAG TPA: PAS domain-containing sensor histidine kinase [Albitalea sp.]|nr:PAS domain-containing sensor histidine kinase [Albitalea sp.]